MNNLKKMVRKALVAVVAILVAPGALASGESDIIGRIDSRMADLNALIFTQATPNPGPNALASSVEVLPDSTYNIAVDLLTQARVSEIKAQTGLQLTGQAYYRPDSALGIGDEEEAVSPYLGKIQVEARWYFLQSGLLKRQGRIEELRLRGELDRLQHERERTNPGIYAQRESLLAISDSLLASVMLHRVDNLDLLEQAYLYLLGNENISSDELLRILDDRAEAQRRLATIATEPRYADNLAAVAACSVNVDTTALLKALADTDLELKILGLKGELLERQADNTTWWSDVRLAPFVRYSHYFRHAMQFSQNVDAGLSFTIPLNGEAAKRRKTLRTQKGLLDCEREDMLQKAGDKIRYLAREINRMNRAIEAECRRAIALKEYLSMRRTAYSNRAGEFNRLAALKEYNSYLRCLESIIELQYRRDSYIADMQAVIPNIPILDFCTSVTIDC